MHSDEAAFTAQECFPDRIVPLRFDVTDHEATVETISRFADAHPLDGVAAAAGLAMTGVLLRQSFAALHTGIQTNLMGTILTVKAALPYLMRRDTSSILTFSSVAAATPTSGQAVYAATKGGVESFTKAVAVEYARKGVRAACLRLGPIQTDMLDSLSDSELGTVRERTMVKRTASVEEVAAYALSVLEQSYITGSVLPFDGGYRA